MKRYPFLGLALGIILVCSGCVRKYTITMSSGHTTTCRGKPKYDKDNSCYHYTDLRGERRHIPAGSVSLIAPASDKEDTTGFNPKPSR